jgi:phospholipid/cholesterol/gamma-HCH transport system substrate-binding protein
METRANYAIVGLFALIVIAAAFGFIYWMAQYGRGGPMEEMVIRIPGSANGLSVGSPVRFNGISIGTVRSLAIDAEDPKFSVAFTEVNADAPIYKSTKAILEIQGLTGAAYIELSGGETGEENLLEEARKKDERAVLLADQSSVTNLLATADKILGRADKAIGDIQQFVEESRQPLTNTVRNAETFSKALSDNADGVNEFLKSVSTLSKTVTEVSGRLDSTLAAAEDLVKSVDRKKIDTILANAETVSRDLADASGEVRDTITKVQQTADSFKQFGDSATVTLAKVDKIVAAVDPAKAGQMVDDASATAADARKAIASIRGVTDDIERRRREIDQMVSDASSMVKRLNGASERVNQILVKVDGIVSSDDSQGLIAEAKKTVQSFGKVAETLNSRIGPIADNLARFSGTGLRDVQTLVGETRQAVQGLSETINNFDRNPQRLIFGGETVKQYDGRVRR